MHGVAIHGVACCFSTLGLAGWNLNPLAAQAEQGNDSGDQLSTLEACFHWVAVEEVHLSALHFVIVFVELWQLSSSSLAATYFRVLLM